MTMRHVARLALLALVWLLTLSGRPAFATCVTDNQGPCYRYWHTDAVLLGEVRDSMQVGEQTVEGLSLGRTYRLRVEVLEGFRGVGAAGEIVSIESSTGECGFHVGVGERVFFYATRRSDGTLGATMYSRRFEDAEDDLDYARSAATGTAAARVYGDVLHRDDTVDDSSPFKPLANVRVRVRGVGFDAKVTTDDEGHYSIRLPGAGRYEVTVDPPPGLAQTFPSTSSITIGNPQECMLADFHLLTNGRIRGIVVDETTGRPIPNLVLRAGDDLQESKTDRSGAFDIGPLPAGEHRVEAMTGGSGVLLLPGSVYVEPAKPTVLRPLVARVSRPLSTVIFDLRGLPGHGWIGIDELSYGLQVGRTRSATFAVERGTKLELVWGAEDGDTRKATVTIDDDIVRIRLSELAWRPAL